MANKKTSAKKIKDLPTGMFFRLTYRKLLIDLVLSFVLVILFFYLLPFARSVYMQETLFQKIVDILVNTVIYMLIFYPLSCYITLKIFEKERQ